MFVKMTTFALVLAVMVLAVSPSSEDVSAYVANITLPPDLENVLVKAPDGTTLAQCNNTSKISHIVDGWKYDCNIVTRIFTITPTQKAHPVNYTYVMKITNRSSTEHPLVFTKIVPTPTATGLNNNSENSRNSTPGVDQTPTIGPNHNSTTKTRSSRQNGSTEEPTGDGAPC